MADVQCPKFNTGDWEEWIENFEAFALLKEWDDDKKLKALPFYLEGSARQSFKSLTDDQRALWATTRDTLRDIFVCDDDNAEVQFYARRQETGETFAMFAAALQFLGRTAFADHSAVTRERLLLRQFLIGIDPRLAEETARTNPATLTAAVAAAQTARCVQKTLAEIEKHSTAAGQNQVKAAQCMAAVNPDAEFEKLKQMLENLSMSVRELRATTQQLEQERQPKKGSETDGMRVRWRSPSPQRQGWARDARPTESERQGATSPSSRQRSEYDRQVRCYGCNERGHIRRKCPKRKVSEN